MSNISLLSFPIFSRALIGCPFRILDSNVSGPYVGRFYFSPSWLVYLLHEK
jgi:hypothetical protein